jgi:hypothetical protein
MMSKEKDRAGKATGTGSISPKGNWRGQMPLKTLLSRTVGQKKMMKKLFGKKENKG